MYREVVIVPAAVRPVVTGEWNRIGFMLIILGINQVLCTQGNFVEICGIIGRPQGQYGQTCLVDLSPLTEGTILNTTWVKVLLG
jgi:hypothetical protein